MHIATRSAWSLAALLALAACSDSTGPKAGQTLALSFNGLEPLLNGFHYEAWALVGGQALPAGKFNISSTGSLVSVSGAAIPNGEINTGINLSGTTSIVITIEPSGDTDDIPAATHIVAGTVSGGMAALSVSAPAALGNPFSSAAGQYILATPTDGANNNELSGLWFLSLASGSPAVGLTLPTLPSGWAYEGWAVIGGIPVTTGRFVSANTGDQSAPFSGPMGSPPFPGEDFLVNAPAGLTFPTTLAGGTAVISIEPQPDDSPLPFTLKPLVGAISTTAMDHVTYALGNNASGFPTGTAVIR